MSESQNIVICVLFGMLIGFLCGTKLMAADFKQQAIEHGAANYDKVTGNWEWNR